MKISIQIAYKTLLELIREKLVLLIIFLFPILLIGMYVIAYGDKGAGLSGQMKIALVNQQAPVKDASQALDRQFLTFLEEMKLDGLPIFAIKEFKTKETAISMLYEKQYAALLMIPDGFNQQISSSNNPATIEIIGDSYAGGFVFAQTFLSAAIEAFNQQMVQQTGETQINSNIHYEFLEGTGTLSDLDFGLSGILVFGLMFLTLSTAQILVREKTNQTFLRYRLSGISAGQIFSGIMLSQLLIALFLIPFTLAAAMLIGVQIQASVWPLLLISGILTISAVGIGLIIACFTRNESEAINIGASAVVPMVLLSNTLYPMEKHPLFTIFGQVISAYDFMPTSVASELLRNSLIYLQPIQDNIFWLIWLGLQALLIFGIGAWLFNHFLFRNLSA